jgi:hypothetical protein
VLGKLKKMKDKEGGSSDDGNNDGVGEAKSAGGVQIDGLRGAGDSGTGSEDESDRE